MRCHARLSLFKRAALAPFAALALVTLTSGAARAQVTPTTRPNEVAVPITEPSELRKLKEPGDKSQGGRASYRDASREFERLQLANRSLAGLVGRDTVTDYARVRKEAAEVNKSASRLKDYLSLPKPDDGGKQKTAEPLGLHELKTAVASLDARVKEFVWNPVLHESGVVDSEKSTQASRDLEGIISLSERIRKCAEGLLKNSVKK
jgi:hypothetical protein